MGAKNASTAGARTLNETRGTALLTMERIAYDQSGRPVEFAPAPVPRLPVPSPPASPAQGQPSDSGRLISCDLLRTSRDLG